MCAAIPALKIAPPQVALELARTIGFVGYQLSRTTALA